MLQEHGTVSTQQSLELAAALSPAESLEKEDSAAFYQQSFEIAPALSPAEKEHNGLQFEHT